MRWTAETADLAVAWAALLAFAWIGLRSDVGTPVGVMAGQMSAWSCLAVAGYAGWRAVWAGRRGE